MKKNKMTVAEALTVLATLSSTYFLRESGALPEKVTILADSVVERALKTIRDAQ